jgi:hypothetical protein
MHWGAYLRMTVPAQTTLKALAETTLMTTMALLPTMMVTALATGCFHPEAE